MREPEFTGDTYCPRCYEALTKAEPNPDLVPGTAVTTYYLAHDPQECMVSFVRRMLDQMNELTQEMKNISQNTSYAISAIDRIKDVIRDK